MLSARVLIKEWDAHTRIDGLWYPARPAICCLRCRIRDAWAVLIGRADAVKWPGGQ